MWCFSSTDNAAVTQEVALPGVACVSQTSQLVDKEEDSDVLSLLKSSVAFVGCLRDGLGQYLTPLNLKYWILPVDRFHRLPYPGSSLQLVDSDTFSFVWFLPPVKSSLTYIYFEGYSRDSSALENLAVVGIHTAPSRVSDAPRSVGPGDTDVSPSPRPQRSCLC